MIRRLAASAVILTSLGLTNASAEDLVFMLDNQSSYIVTEFYSSPRNVNDWEEDILGSDVLEAGGSDAGHDRRWPGTVRLRFAHCL